LCHNNQQLKTVTAVKKSKLKRNYIVVLVHSPATTIIYKRLGIENITSEGKNQDSLM